MAETEKAIYKGPTHKVTLAGTVSQYEALAHNGTNWVRADADWTAANPLFARAFALTDGVSGDVIEAAEELVLEDVDAPYTQDATYYLSTTAGAKTTTAPTAADDLVQVLGVAKNTSILHLKIDPPKLVTVVYNPTGGTDAPSGQLDSGNMGGFSANASNDVVFFAVVWPRQAVSLERANLWLAAEATAGTPTFDMFTSNAVDGEQWDAATQDSGIANSAGEGAAADEIQMTAVTAGMDLTDHGPGALLGIRLLKDDSGTDQTFFFALETVWRCV